MNFSELISLFSPNLSEFSNTDDKPTSYYKRIVCLVDGSGSTLNVGSLGRRFSKVEVPKSKPIFVAECEGVAHVLAKFSNEFNMEDVSLEVVSFSEKIVKAEPIKTNSEGIYNVAKEFIRYVTAEGSGTYTLGALNAVFENHDKVDTLLILATDGQPNDTISQSDKNIKTIIIEYLNSLYKSYNENGKKLDCIVIGAGSIMESAGENIKSHINTSASVRGKYQYLGSAAECDIKFLHEIAEVFDNSAYFPACNDYTELLTALDEFTFNIKGEIVSVGRKWRVVLESGLAPVEPLVNSALERLPNNTPFVAYTSYGFYMFCKNGLTGFQVKVKDQPYKKDIAYVVSKSPFKILDFNTLFGSKYIGDTIFTMVDEHEGTTLTGTLELTSSQYLRIRELI
jgi:hypothetical protein